MDKHQLEASGEVDKKLLRPLKVEHPEVVEEHSRAVRPLEAVAHHPEAEEVPEVDVAAVVDVEVKRRKVRCAHVPVFDISQSCRRLN